MRRDRYSLLTWPFQRTLWPLLGLTTVMLVRIPVQWMRHRLESDLNAQALSSPTFMDLQEVSITASPQRNDVAIVPPEANLATRQAPESLNTPIQGSIEASSTPTRVYSQLGSRVANERPESDPSDTEVVTSDSQVAVETGVIEPASSAMERFSPLSLSSNTQVSVDDTRSSPLSVNPESATAEDLAVESEPAREPAVEWATTFTEAAPEDRQGATEVEPHPVPALTADQPGPFQEQIEADRTTPLIATGSADQEGSPLLFASPTGSPELGSSPPGTSADSMDPYVIIENPVRYQVPLGFLVNEQERSLLPGATLRLERGDEPFVTVRFHQGGESTVEKTEKLTPGRYEFVVRAEGWCLRRVTGL